jgi:hypothetical protein
MYSAVHVISYIRVVSPRKAFIQGKLAQGNNEPHASEPNSAIVSYIAAFSEHYVGTGRAFTRILETILWLHLFHASVLSNKRSYILIIFYTLFLGGRWARYHADGRYSTPVPGGALGVLYSVS